MVPSADQIIHEAMRLPEKQRVLIIDELLRSLGDPDRTVIGELWRLWGRLRDGLMQVKVVKTPGVCGGRARVGDTRIPVWFLVQSHQDGVNDAKLLEGFPTLTPEHLQVAWDYFKQHPDEIRADIAEQDVEEDDGEDG